MFDKIQKFNLFLYGENRFYPRNIRKLTQTLMTDLELKTQVPNKARKDAVITSGYT
jgi:hypothetical protein